VIRNSIVVRRPVDSVFAYAAQFDRHPEWQPDLKGAEFDGPAAVGKTGVETRQVGRRTHSYQWRVSAYDSPHTLGFETLSGPMRPAGTMRFSPDGESTRVTFEMFLNPRGFMRLVAPIIERQVRRGDIDHLERFKGILERTD
jgi:uncharacterized membrane protein